MQDIASPSLLTYSEAEDEPSLPDVTPEQPAEKATKTPAKGTPAKPAPTEKRASVEPEAKRSDQNRWRSDRQEVPHKGERSKNVSGHGTAGRPVAIEKLPTALRPVPGVTPMKSNASASATATGGRGATKRNLADEAELQGVVEGDSDEHVSDIDGRDRL